MGNHGAACQPHALSPSHRRASWRCRGMLEDRVPITKCALRSIECEAVTADQIHCIQLMKAVLQFYAIGTNVLHRSCSHRPRNQCQIFQTTVALLYRPLHQVVPAHTGTRLHNPAAICLTHQRHAGDFHLQDDGIDHIALEHNIAATAQHKDLAA